MYCPSFPEAPTMQTLIVCVPERPGHSVSSDSPLDAARDEGLRGLGAGSDSMRTTPRSGTFREHSRTAAPSPRRNSPCEARQGLTKARICTLEMVMAQRDAEIIS